MKCLIALIAGMMLGYACYVTGWNRGRDCAAQRTMAVSYNAGYLDGQEELLHDQQILDWHATTLFTPQPTYTTF